MGLKIVKNGTEYAIPLAVEAKGGAAIEAHMAKVGASESTGDTYTEAGLNELTVPEIQALLPELGMTEDDIDGTGSEGRNLKEDYIRAILAAQGGEV